MAECVEVSVLKNQNKELTEALRALFNSVCLQMQVTGLEAAWIEGSAMDMADRLLNPTTRGIHNGYSEPNV
jgi:hypothetical protein